MKRRLGTFALWMVLLIVAAELCNAAYNFLYFPLIDPATNKVHYGRTIPDLILLSVYVLIFGISGAIIAWRMQGVPLAVATGMGLGAVWLALEIGFHIPWFQLMPAHPTTYDHLMAFFGALSAPSAGALGAYSYCWVRLRREQGRYAT